MAIVAERYVKALLDSSKDSNDANQAVEYQQELKDIANLYSTDKEFKTLLLNPCVSNEEKLNTIKGIFPEYFQDITFTNFFSELLKKDRINLIEDISNQYSKVNDSINKKLSIKIYVANTPNEDQINEIVNKYKKQYNANTVDYEIELDESVIGGVKVAVGNTIYDGTVDTRLKQIF